MRVSGFAVALGAVLAGPLYAQQGPAWMAFVSGQSQGQSRGAFIDAFLARTALVAGGLEIGAMERDATLAEFDAGLARMAGARRVVFYHAGDMDGDRLLLADGSRSLSEVATRLRTGGTERILMLIENCDASRTSPSSLRVSEQIGQLGVSVIATVGPALLSCPERGRRLTERLARLADQDLRGRDLVAELSGLWSTGLPPLPVLFDAPAPAQAALATAGAAANADPDGPLLLPVAMPRPAAEPRPLLQQADVPVIFASLPSAQLAARPLDEGLPQPSIIVGLIQGLSAPEVDPLATAEDATNDLPTIVWNDLNTRRTLREQNEALFLSLVAAGSFDPPEDELVVALQTELTRFQCYTRAIDGDWGPGSIAGARLYFQTRAEPVPATDPTFELFRTFIRNDEVRCPAVAAAVQAAPAPAQTAAPALAPAPAPAPAQQPAAGASNFGLGSGL